MEAQFTQYPTLMEGKKILYVHGFASSGASGTAKSLRQLMPAATVISPDLPLSAKAAIDRKRTVQCYGISIGYAAGQELGQRQCINRGLLGCQVRV